MLTFFLLLLHFKTSSFFLEGGGGFFIKLEICEVFLVFWLGFRPFVPRSQKFQLECPLRSEFPPQKVRKTSPTLTLVSNYHGLSKTRVMLLFLTVLRAFIHIQSDIHVELLALYQWTCCYTVWMSLIPRRDLTWIIIANNNEWQHEDSSSGVFNANGQYK